MASTHVSLISAGGTANRRIASSIYGYCTTAAATAAKTVSLYTGNGTTADGTWAAADLFHGLTISVRFQYANGVASPTLNVNGTGDKPIYRYGTTAPSTSAATSWTAQAVVDFTYDTLLNTSGCWVMHSTWDNNNTYTNASLGQGYGTCTTAAATVAKVVTLSSYALTTGGIVSVKFDYDVPANATMNINSKGAKAIYHRGAAITSNVIRAGDIATFIYDGTQYHLLAIDRLSMPTSFSTTVGDGEETDFTIAHNLNTKNIITSVVINDSYIAPLTGLQTINQIGYQVTFVDNNSFTIKFTDAPTSNGATINVININTMTPQDGSYLIV